MTTPQDESRDEKLLLQVVDTIFVSRTSDAMGEALATLFRDGFQRAAVGLMICGAGDDQRLAIAIAPSAPETTAPWRARIERAAAERSEPGDNVVALPLRHAGEQLGVLYLPAPGPVQAATLDRIATWLYRRRQFERGALLDPLTGLYNRHHLEEIATRVQHLCRRNRQPVSLALLDVDHFKAVNDHYGHLQGDRVLATFAATLRQTIRRSDFAFRLGGDEFMILMPETPLAGAVQALCRIQAAAQDAGDQDAPSCAYRFSAGVAEGCGEDQWRDWLAQADKALYAAKRAGGNQIGTVQPGSQRIECLPAPSL